MLHNAVFFTVAVGIEVIFKFFRKILELLNERVNILITYKDGIIRIRYTFPMVPKLLI